MLIEETPHQIIEGILIGAYAIGCKHAFIYIRGEFLAGARSSARRWSRRARRVIVGEKLFGTATSIELTVHRGAGAYICGEETALLNSLEGKRGEPRLKPPFPAVKGLYGEPTVVNNVETLAYAAADPADGPEWFAAVGHREIARLQNRVGQRAREEAGNYEVPLGMTLRELIEIAGGLRDGPHVHGDSAGRRFLGVPLRRTSRLAVRLRDDGAEPARCWARVRSSCSTTRPISSRRRTRSSVSTRTSRAASARRAARAATGSRSTLERILHGERPRVGHRHAGPGQRTRSPASTYVRSAIPSSRSWRRSLDIALLGRAVR